MPVVHDEYSTLDHKVGFSRELAGKECGRCKRALPYSVFSKDSSSRDGYKDICPRCLATPRLSASENLSKQREDNFRSVADQRREDEDLYLDRDDVGRSLTAQEIIVKLKKILGTKLVVAPAYFLNEVSLYVEDKRQENGFRYVGFLELDGRMQEHSSYRYDDLMRPVDETRRGYRGLLLKLIMSKVITEQECSKQFGICEERIWCKSLYNWRNTEQK